MSRYGIREMFNTLQGEGANAGRRAVFVRFSGCNLWDGNPLHRDEPGNGACARWCDTDFRKGKVYDVAELLAKMNALWPRWPDGPERRLAVFTGGEPLLQLDAELLRAARAEGWDVAVETNGTVEPAPDVLLSVAWLTCSPKRGSEVKLSACDELKVVLPGCAPTEGDGWTDAELRALGERFPMAKWYVQPQDPLASQEVEHTVLRVKREEQEPVADAFEAQWTFNLARTVDYVMRNPAWTLSLQQHKFLGMP